MNLSKKIQLYSGWLVFIIAFVVYYLSAERSGSLWDCGEFILGAYKLQVVHPPGAPFFLLVGRLFSWVADIFSNNPQDIAFGVNLLSGICSAFAATFVAWSTMILGKLALFGRGESDPQYDLSLGASGLVAGLATAFASSIWFSAVEGEVYAMSTFFTALTVWAALKWYSLPNDRENDKWLVFSIYAIGLSIGVHLLSLLALPIIALLYYFKKYERHNWRGGLIALGAGALGITLIQKLIIVGIPTLWSWYELIMVNSFGLPFQSGIIPTILTIAVASYFALRYAKRRGNQVIQLALISALLVALGSSTIGIVVIRANANPAINMNNASDVMRLIPYLNREQYGERALFSGPSYDSGSPIRYDTEDRYGRVGDRYEIVEQKYKAVYRASDKMFFPRMGDKAADRQNQYKQWTGNTQGKSTFGQNLSFFLKYQVSWMYWRYFMWNFAGRQNGEQGFVSWNPKSGNWLSGIKPFDSAKLYNQSNLPETIKNHKARNKYYFLPVLFGLLGVFYHYRKRKKDFISLLILFLITGLGIIVYSNQPPSEPRERDYVLAASFFTFCIWIGLGVLALLEIIRQRTKISLKNASILSGVIVLMAPLIMGFQNFDDHSRRHLLGSRDYANNFLESCEPNAIIFTFGDNDTYPLWYAQEVEGIRTDVRVVNLSLIAVDWYINQLRRKINDSAPIKLTVSAASYRGDSRNQVFAVQDRPDNLMSAHQVLKFVDETHPIQVGNRRIPTFLPTRKMFIPIDPNLAVQRGMVEMKDAPLIQNRIDIDLGSIQYIRKDQLAVLDILTSNIMDRPIYFSMTSQLDRMLGLQKYCQLEGLAYRITPIVTPQNTSAGMYGIGRVNAEKAYDNLMNKFKWGNFDKNDLFVDRSFGPSIAVHQIAFQRVAVEFLTHGDTTKAVELVDLYFRAFPHMNFPYELARDPFIATYIEAGEFEKAKTHLWIWAEETADFLDFYYSISASDRQAGFASNFNRVNQSKNRIILHAARINDPALQDEINQLLAPFQTQNVPN